MSEKPGLVLALDIDDTLADFNGKLLDIYNNRYGSPILKPEHFNQSDIYDCFDKETAHKLINIFNEPGFFLDLKLLPDAQETMDILYNNKQLELHFCTAPPRRSRLIGPQAVNPGAASEKISWVIDKFPHLAQNIIIISHKYLIRADVLIDDNITNIKKWCQANPKGLGYLIAKPWNAMYQDLPLNSIRGALVDVPKVLQDKKLI